MTSKIREFQFRSPYVRLKLDAAGINGNTVARLLLEHAEHSILQGICPLCHKPFGDCQYLQKLGDRKSA